MKLIRIALRHCKKVVCILLILLVVAVPGKGYTETSTYNPYGDVKLELQEISGKDEFKLTHDEVVAVLDKAQVVEWNTFDDIMKEGTRFVVVDYITGRYWVCERTWGGNHADVETIDKESTNSLNKVKHDHAGWKYRPVLIIFDDGSVYAASSFVVAHAGVDGKDPYPNNVYFRSGGYGYGPNLDKIANNGANGHYCVHVRKSTNHFDGNVNQEHQKNIDYLEQEQKRLRE